MGQFRKATIRDVAARSGVSTTTVSNFVSGHKNVCAPETAERIREAIAALHYTPSSLTRGLRHSPSTTIGVCLPHPLDGDVFFGFFFLERLWRGIIEQADHDNYSLLHYPHAVRAGDGSAAFLDGRVDGMLLRAEDNIRSVQLAAAGMPTVLLTRSIHIPDGCGAVWADETDTVHLALEHLWSLGHRRIAHIAGPVGRRTLEEPAPSEPGRSNGADIAIQRMDGYIAWMQQRGVFDPSLIAFANAWNAPQAGLFLRKWRALEQPPTAIFCANDAQAMAVCAAAQQMGLHIPESLSVIGVDNSHEARDCDPPLTSVEVPMDIVGREAMAAVLRMIRGASPADCHIAVPVTNLAARRSTGLVESARARGHRT